MQHIYTYIDSNMWAHWELHILLAKVKQKLSQLKTFYSKHFLAAVLLFFFLSCFNFTYFRMYEWNSPAAHLSSCQLAKRLTRSQLLRALNLQPRPPSTTHRPLTSKNSRRRQTDMSLLIWALEKFRVKCAPVEWENGKAGGGGGGTENPSQITWKCRICR